MHVVGAVTILLSMSSDYRLAMFIVVLKKRAHSLFQIDVTMLLGKFSSPLFSLLFPANTMFTRAAAISAVSLRLCPELC